MDQAKGQTATHPAGASRAGFARLGPWLTAVLAVPVSGFAARAGFSRSLLAVVPGEPVAAWFVHGLALTAGLASAIGLMAPGPPAWVEVLICPAPMFPRGPLVPVTMLLASAVCTGGFLRRRSRRAGQDRAGLAERRQRMGGAIARAAG